jgi:hypothetical protein
MIVANIREVGLKKLITVVRRSEPHTDETLFDLVCGQGRIEAFLALGETTIPISIPAMPFMPSCVVSFFEIAGMSFAFMPTMLPIPISATVRMGRGSICGISATMHNASLSRSGSS